MGMGGPGDHWYSDLVPLRDRLRADAVANGWDTDLGAG